MLVVSILHPLNFSRHLCLGVQIVPIVGGKILGLTMTGIALVILCSDHVAYFSLFPARISVVVTSGISISALVLIALVPVIFAKRLVIFKFRVCSRLVISVMVSVVSSEIFSGLEWGIILFFSWWVFVLLEFWSRPISGLYVSLDL